MNIDEIYEKKIVHFQSIKNNISKLLKMFHIKTSVSFNKICYYDNEKKNIKKRTSSEYHNNIYESILIKLNSSNIDKLIESYHIKDKFENNLISLFSLILNKIIKFKSNIRKFNLSYEISYLITKIPKYENYFNFNINIKDENINSILIMLILKLEKVSNRNILSSLNIKHIPKPVLKKYKNTEYKKENTITNTILKGCIFLLEREKYYLDYLSKLKKYVKEISLCLKDITKTINGIS